MARAALSLALDAIQHRGPDGEGEWFGATRACEEIAFGHRRLAIIDIAGSPQPLASHDGRFTLTYNGEIYNYIELREELLALGHVFATSGDTEVIIEAYRRWGTKSFPRLRGMFAFALWDAAENRLVLARDPVGKKPLYLADMPGGFAFASEIGALRQLPGVDGAPDLDRVPAYLIRRYIDGPATFFSRIRKLSPGHFLVHEDGQSRQDRFYESPLLSVQPRLRPLAENVERLGFMLDECVRLRMRSDAPFGLFLSGGLDSSIVLAIMHRHSSTAVRTFSVGFEGDVASELSHASSTARDFDAEHRELYVSATDFAANWAHCVALRGAPVSEASDVAIFLLSQAARSSVKMVLTGEGADELLGGYPKFWGERWLARYHRVVRPSVHRALLHPLVARLPYGYERLKILSRAAGTHDLETRARTWFSSGDVELVTELTRALPEIPAAELPPHLGPVRALQVHDFAHWLPDNLLERGDRMMMGGSVEGRMPFMDTELAHLAAGFPEEHLVQGRRGKVVLRELAKQLLRPDLISRPKIGFTVPLGSWFRGPLRPMLNDLLKSEQSRVRPLIDGIVLDRIFASHMAGHDNHSKLLWTLANLELFLRLNS